MLGYVRVKGQIGSCTLPSSSSFASRDPSIFLKFGLSVLWSYLSMWLKYCVGLSMGLGFNGYYIQQRHNFCNKLYCTCIPYDSSKTSYDIYNKNIKLCLFDERVS